MSNYDPSTLLETMQFVDPEAAHVHAAQSFTVPLKFAASVYSPGVETEFVALKDLPDPLLPKLPGERVQSYVYESGATSFVSHFAG
jgi:hypothetical protein